MKYKREEAIQIAINHLKAALRIADDYTIGWKYLVDKAKEENKDTQEE